MNDNTLEGILIAVWKAGLSTVEDMPGKKLSVKEAEAQLTQMVKEIISTGDSEFVTHQEHEARMKLRNAQKQRARKYGLEIEDEVN